EKVPYSGTVTGTLASAADSTAAQGLVVNLLARVTPRGESGPESVLALRGPVAVGGEGAMVRFEGLRVAMQPLYLSLLRPLAPPSADERLRGVVHGAATLFGTPDQIRLENGELTYEVDDAPPTRLTGLALTATLQPELRFDLRMRADPLALGTLSALFPAFPFRTARFAGPVRISGTMQQLTVNADLAGAAGGISVHGTVSPGAKPLAFDLSGELRSFNAESVVSAAVPVQGPVTGSYQVAGNLNDLRFNVALAQDTGSFALHGTVVRPGGGAPRFSVAGNVTNFNLGMLIGRPRLLPGRVSGPISLTGGGNAPYQFNVDLTGNGGRLNLSGYFASGATPTFQLNGEVAGLNLAQLPLPVPLPQSSINGFIALQGSGKTLETLTGTLRLDATGSVIGGLPVEAMRAKLAVANGIVTVDTFTARFAGNVLTANGMFGLTRPAPRPLDFRVVAPDLARLAALTGEAPALEANITGSFTLQGALSGWLKAPVLNARFRGRQLRYEDYAAQQLSFDADATLPVGNQQLRGTISLVGTGVTVAGTALDSVRLALRGGVDQVEVRLAAIRDNASDLSLAGLVELEGTTPRGLVLDSLAVHLGSANWTLASRAQIRWGGVHGVAISNLDLRRADGEPGSILVNGTVPPTGTAGLRVTVRDFDLALVERALPSHPALAGLVNLDALLTGPVTDPHLALRLAGNGLQYAGVTTDSLRLTANYDSGALKGNATAWTGGLQVAQIEATVPMRLQVGGGVPSVDLLRTEPLQARIVADSVPLGLLTGPLGFVQNGAGVIDAQVTVGGSIDQPSLNGSATIRDGAVTIPSLGVRYQRISGRVEMEDQLLRIDTLTAWNGGQAVVDGTVRFPDLIHPELFLTTTFNGFHLVDDPDLADLTLSGRVALTGSYPQPTLTGAVTLQQGTIHIPSTVGNRVAVDITAMDIGEIGPDTLANAVGPGPLAAVKLQDLNVTVNEGVWIESEDFRVQIRGLLRGYGTVGDPRIFGTLEAVRGTYTLSIGPLVRDFEVVSGSVRFTGGSELNPDLDITAAHEVRVVGGASSASSTLTVLVHLTGTLDFPHVALTSDTRPPLPESELLNYLIFGRPSFQTAATSGGANPAQQLLVQQLLIQEFLGGLLVQEVGHASSLCDYLQLRGRPDLL
ncbi:MAG TPA: translocation/assembly module TamB domain-containing protein, partial [Longimicrobiaceae bacterium]|nr:translocation/assembly module TamB domain-containing protein [Longimicrobiaceae bacterium]